MERLINRRQQGDLGEASAIEWLTRAGAVVFLPFGHSPDVDLVALVDGRALRVQVKTTVRRIATRGGDERWHVILATRGGNRSWTGKVKVLDRSTVEYLFVLTGAGRRWFIPAAVLEGTTALHLGGPRYSEFEIERGGAIEQLVYGPAEHCLESDAARGSAGVWRAGPDCKFGALALSEFESHLPHSSAAEAGPGPGSVASTRISRNRQVTIPRPAFEASGFAVADRLRVEPVAEGRVLLTRIDTPHHHPTLFRNDEGPPDGGPSVEAALDRG